MAVALDTLPRRRFEVGAELVSPGRIDQALWWIDSGLVRLYSLGTDGLSRNHDFHGPGEWICGGLVFRDGRLCCESAALGVQAIKPTVAARVPLDWCEQHRRESPEISDWVAEELMELSSRRLQREMALLQTSAEQRYLELLRDRPDLARALAQHQIASWLGITPVALSRIRRRLKSTSPRSV